MTYKTRFAFLMNRAKDIARHADMSSALPPLFLFTDPKRTPHPEDITAQLPEGAGVIYRHFGDSHAAPHARVLRTLTQERGLRLFIGNDVDLALEVEADGVHLPEQALSQAPDIRAAHPRLWLTAACHSLETLKASSVASLDGVFISPIFSSRSPSAQDTEALGLKGIRPFCEHSPVPVFGLGGINADNAESLTKSGLAGFGAVDAFHL